MAKYFSLSTATFAIDFKAALEAYYGDGVIIESASGDTIIFQCPAVCDKVLKFRPVYAGVEVYVGDTSASMTNLTSFGWTDNFAPSFNLILSDVFIIIDALGSNNQRNSVLVAKLSNGRYMVSSGAVSYIDHRCCFTDTMAFRPIRMVAPSPIGAKSKGKLCLFPSYVADDMEVELNVDGTFANIQGLWFAATTGTPITGSNYYLSQSGLVGSQQNGYYCYTQKYVELETD